MPTLGPPSQIQTSAPDRQIQTSAPDRQKTAALAGAEKHDAIQQIRENLASLRKDSDTDETRMTDTIRAVKDAMAQDSGPCFELYIQGRCCEL